MDEVDTNMLREIRSIPIVTQELLSGGAENAQAIGAELRRLDPFVLTTIARGSSDHAAAYLKYAIELTCNIPVASTGPSVGSVYNAPMKLQKAATIAISQSGESPDIVSMAETARAGGSMVVSLTNTPRSPLANTSDHSFHIGAGPELSVAATKTFVASVVAGLMLVAEWKQDSSLSAALQRLPDEIQNALECDWSALADRLCARLDSNTSLFVLGRGPSFAIAKECALKFKETCQLHAEAYSSAEVLHGPISLARAGFPVLMLVSRDAAETGTIEAGKQLAKRGVEVFVTANALPAVPLPFAKGSHPLTDPLLQVVSFYVFVELLSRRLGLHPDDPPHLRKVTQTV